MKFRVYMENEEIVDIVRLQLIGGPNGIVDLVAVDKSGRQKCHIMTFKPDGAFRRIKFIDRGCGLDLDAEGRIVEYN